MKQLTAGVLCMTFVLLGSSEAQACLCANRSVNQLKKESKAVFTGKVVEVSREFDNYAMFYRVKLSVERTWKNAQAGEITVYSRGGCSVWFVPGKEYLVYAYAGKDGNTLETDLCSKTRQVGMAEEDLKKLGKAKTVEKVSRSNVN